MTQDEPTRDAGMVARLREVVETLRVVAGPDMTRWYFRDEHVRRVVQEDCESLLDKILESLPSLLDLAAERGREWQPIETAPKGEMFIYYWPRNGKRCIGLAYLAMDDSWRDSQGDWSTRLEPTHWMPLPEPPHD